jgi:hypothetical protein
LAAVCCACAQGLELADYCYVVEGAATVFSAQDAGLGSVFGEGCYQLGFLVAAVDCKF